MNTDLRASSRGEDGCCEWLAVSGWRCNMEQTIRTCPTAWFQCFPMRYRLLVQLTSLTPKDYSSAL